MMSAGDFLGLTKKRAQDICESKNMIFRLIRIDDTRFLDYPEDNRPDRVCVEIDQSKISKAVIQ